MIQRILQFAIRKDILKHNKAINHKALVRSMDLGTKIPFLAKYHKKKLIALALALLIIQTYDLHKPIYRKIVSMRSPLNFLESLIVEQRKIPNTLIEQNYAGIGLSESTIKFLVDMFIYSDKYLYFGVGRNYLFRVYKELGVIQTEEETRKFWMASGFYKERNQKAAGVGLVEFLTLFQQAFSHAKKNNSQLTQFQFLSQFSDKFIEVAPEIIKWEKQFNKQRNQQFLKNMPGDNEKKKDAIIQIMRDVSKSNQNLLTQAEMQQRIKQMGLKGLNLTDKLLFWQLKRVWYTVRIVTLQKKISHPLTTESDRLSLSRQKDQIVKNVQQCEDKIGQIQTSFQNLYQQKIF